MTHVEYDKKGRVASVVTTREPEFTERDRLLILASRRADAAPRGSHGVLLSEATDPKNAYAFEVDLPTTDFAQKALNDAQETYQKQNEDVDMGVLLWSVTKRP